MKHSNSFFAVTLSVVATAAALTPAHALLTARSVPPASFLDYHVDTVPQLTFEVTYDKTVQTRLAHHFHLTGPAMSAYVQNDLVLQHLRAPLRTRVYCVSPRGHEYFVLMTLKTGTPVFALRRTGQPILRLVCGNPLVSTLPAGPKKPLAARPAVKPAAKTLVEGAQSEQGTPVVTTAAPSAWSVPPVLTSGSGETLFTQGTSGAGWLALLPAAGLVGVIATHHGSGDGGGQDVPQTPSSPQNPGSPPPSTPSTPLPPTGGVPGGPSPTPPDGPAPVPEPSPALVFALGSLTLGALRLRRK